VIFMPRKPANGCAAMIVSMWFMLYSQFSSVAFLRSSAENWAA
jgi:hypothetical protein